MSVTTASVTYSRADHRRAQIAYGEPIYNQVMTFLINEARLLDHRELKAWGELLAEDIAYKAPVRMTRRVGQFDEEFGTMGHFDDDYASLMTRIKRLVETKNAWSEDPASRVRRFVSNVSVWETDQPNEYEVSSYLFLTRNRAEARDYKQLSAERDDRLRWTGSGFLLAKRSILVDQVVLGMPNFAIFL
jgi:3-phenylpropionate/cinnamic acid dioxygenase small subunit